MDAVMAQLAAADAAMLGMAGALCILIAALIILLARRGGTRQEKVLERELQQLVQAQSEMQGRMATMAELFGSRQSELNAALGSRLDGLSQRIGTTLHQHPMPALTQGAHAGGHHADSMFATLGFFRDADDHFAPPESSDGVSLTPTL